MRRLTRRWFHALTSAVLAATLVMTGAAAVTAWAESNGGVRVMPLGDSITHGTQVPGGYRIGLWQRFANNRFRVDLVGSQFNGPASLGDHDHEGHPGWRIDQIDANIVNWVRTTNPHSVLLHIGTNDVLQNFNLPNAPARLSTLVDRVTATAPTAEVFVATIIPLANATQEANARRFNATIPGIVQSKVNAGKHVHLVNMHAALTTADLIDGIHPTATGYNKMANTWFNALRSVPGSIGNPGAAPAGIAAAPAAQVTNPVLWEDLADIDIFRVGNTFYYSASTMHYSPGAPILRSYDLVNWEFAGHSVPRLDFGSKYDLNGGRGYVRGIWASFLNFRRSNNTFYWGGCVDFNQTHIYTATTVEGPWQKRSTIPNCYYDPGLLIDDNDTMYVAYGNTNISVAQLSADGLSQVRTQQVFSTPPSIGTLEGARFYKRNGNYYIFLTRPANGQYILKSTNGPFGPYTIRQVLLDLRGPISGGGVPHQGGLVQTQNGDWYYLAFVDAFPGGRVPVLAPISWTSDGWPVLQTVNGAWGTTYPAPNLPPPPRAVKPPTGVDTFAGTALGPEWEWNHNPDSSRWSVNNGLRLQTATVTNDLYSARNTLTHRILGPTSTATITLDYSGMRDGDRTGLGLLRDSSAWIGVKRDRGATRVVMVNGLTMDGNWNTTGTGTEVAGASVSGGRIWLRVNADIRPGTGRQGRFSYSTNGVNFAPLGPGFVMGNDWHFFMGYRFAIFNYATQALGGAVTVPRFELTTP